MKKFSAAMIGAIVVSATAPTVSEAKPVGTVQGMPFFGLPYPFGYVYHPPRLECYEFQTVETINGPVVQPIWKCGKPVPAKY